VGQGVVFLIIGGSFSGLAAGRDLGSHYLVTIIDAKEQRSGTTEIMAHDMKKHRKSGCLFFCKDVIADELGKISNTLL